MSQVIKWECSNCGKKCTSKQEDPVCPRCGIRLATWATLKKHEYLQEVYLSNQYDLVIDACAGSGMLQYPDGTIKKGSPCILEDLMASKGNLVCIEVKKRTCSILSKSVKGAEIINADCNTIVPNYVDGETPTLVFIDPNGYGIPPIDRNLVLKLSKTPNTDLLIQYSWRIAREMGFCRKYLNCEIKSCPSLIARKKNLTCDECFNRSRGTAWKKSLDIWWGHSNWMTWGSLTVPQYVEEYASPLRENNKIQKQKIRGKTPYNSYHLIFATKFNLPKIGILKWTK